MSYKYICPKIQVDFYRFGGAFTDAAGINIAHLSTEAQESLIRAYYSGQGKISKNTFSKNTKESLIKAFYSEQGEITE